MKFPKCLQWPSHDRTRPSSKKRASNQNTARISKTRSIARSKAIFWEEKQIQKMTSIGKGSKVDLSTSKKWRKDIGVIATRRLEMTLSNGDIVKDGVIVKMALSSKKRRSRLCPSAKRQKLDEEIQESDSFVATEELAQTSYDESISDESYESDSSVSDDDFQMMKMADSVV